MKRSALLDEIRELNLGYLMLAQQMVREDAAKAMFRLGVNREVAEILDHLTPQQIVKMSANSTLLCRLRCDDRLILDLLSGYGEGRSVPDVHASILMAGQKAEAFA